MFTFPYHHPFLITEKQMCMRMWRYLINHNIKQKDCTFSLGFYFQKFHKCYQYLLECKCHEVPKPQGFLISLQSWWYETTSFYANFYSKTVLSKHFMNNDSTIILQTSCTRRQPPLPPQILDQPLPSYKLQSVLLVFIMHGIDVTWFCKHGTVCSHHAYLQFHVQIMSWDWLEVMFQMRAEWRYVKTMCGALCVMTPGTLLMPVWCVDNWDTWGKVRNGLKVN